MEKKTDIDKKVAKLRNLTDEEIYQWAYKNYDPNKPDPKSSEVFFGEYIRKKREAKGWSLKEAAERYGIGSPYLSDIEKKKQKPPSRQTVIRIASALEMNLKQTNHLCTLAYISQRGLGKDKVAFIRENHYVGLLVGMLMSIKEDFDLEGKPAELAQKYIDDIAFGAIAQINDVINKECPQLYGEDEVSEDDN